MSSVSRSIVRSIKFRIIGKPFNHVRLNGKMKKRKLHKLN